MVDYEYGIAVSALHGIGHGLTSWRRSWALAQVSSLDSKHLTGQVEKSSNLAVGAIQVDICTEVLVFLIIRDLDRPNFMRIELSCGCRAHASQKLESLEKSERFDL